MGSENKMERRNLDLSGGEERLREEEREMPGAIQAAASPPDME